MSYSPKNTNGQATMANSEPVVLASDQASIPVTVSGVATAANQTTVIGHLDGVEGLLTTIDSDTGTIATEVAGLLTDTELRATPVPVSGTVTVTATNLDVQSGGADLATTTQAGAIQTAVELLDDAVYASDAAISKVIGVGGQFDDTTPGTTTENSVRPLRMSTRRELYTQVRDAAGNERGQNVDANGNAGVVLAAETTKVIGTVRMASGGVASGSFASGSIASGAIASGAIAAGAIAAGATSIATTEDTASAASDHLVKVAQIRLDTPVSGANLSASGDYTQFIADSFGKTWTAGSYPEDLAHVAGEPILGNGTRRIDTPATSAGTSGDWATLDSSAEGAVWTTNTPTTTGGCTIFRSIDLDETEEEVKATAGNVYGYYFANTNATARYLKFYNATAASVSVGTTTPVMTMYLPPTSAGHIGFAFPAGFATAITVAATTGVADADTGAPSANDILVNIWYK